MTDGFSDLPPDFPACVIGLIDALGNYRRWLREWAEGVPDRYTGEWEVEPDTRFADALRRVDDMLADLKEWELCSDLSRFKRRY
jgi:hypothetical protein